MKTFYCRLIKFSRCSKTIYPLIRCRLALLFRFCLLFLQCCAIETAAREGLISGDGFALHYRIVGAGDTLVLLHGGPGLEYTYLLPQMDSLAAHHTLIYFDQRFIGGSTGDIDSLKVTFDAFIEDVELVRKYFGLASFHLLGHSFGGLTAMVYTSRHPEKVKTLVLMTSAGADTSWRSRFGEALSKNRSKDDSLTLEEIRKSEAFTNHTPEGLKQYFRVFFTSYFFNPFLTNSLTITVSEMTAKNLWRINSWIGKNIEYYDFRPQLAQIVCPTLIIHGANDPLPLEAAQIIQKAIPHSQLIVLDRCGHFPYIENPVLLFKELDAFYLNPWNCSIGN